MSDRLSQESSSYKKSRVNETRQYDEHLLLESVYISHSKVENYKWMLIYTAPH